MARSSYVLPAILALLLHALVFAGVTFALARSDAEFVQADEQFYVEAMLVKENPLRARERERKAVRRKELATATERKRREQEERDKRAREEEARKRAAEERRRLDEMQQSIEVAAAEEIAANREVERAEEERLRDQRSLSLAIVEEQEYRRAVTDDEKAQAYAAQIKRDIVSNWSRPPTARNGMEAVLKVFLAPTGEVVNVSIVEGSGNEAFDRSAVLAVQKAERFLVPTDPRQFERNFREFSVLFRPEDLRQ